MKVREVITLKGWVDGSGWTYTQCYGNSIIEIREIPESMDWSWWETSEPKDGEDTKITVEYYDENDNSLLSTYSTWESDLVQSDEDE